MLTRRQFLQSAAALGAATFFWRGDTLYARSKETRVLSVVAQLPGGTLNPSGVPKYQTPVLIPPAMKRSDRIPSDVGKNIDYYEIAMRQFQQQILPAPLPKTTVWGYGPLGVKPQFTIFNAPSLTIEATYKRPVRVRWVNELKDANGNYLPHLLPVDPSLHWANPPGGETARDTRPTFGATPGRYTGPVPIVTHVHGSAGVGDESDGYAEAWYLPAANNIPAGYASAGTWYEFFKSKAAAKGYVAPGQSTWEPGTAVFQYPNTQRASTIWYHDHALGMTRLNVYAGPAGFYIIRGGPDDEVRDTRTGRKAKLPGPAPAAGDGPRKKYYEIALAIQDRSFNNDGSLFYPDTRAFFDGISGPFIPETDISPIWNPEFFGNFIMVNGATWPFLNVEQRRYRFRLLNGCDSRFLILDFSGIPGVQVWQIGNEGGLLPVQVDMMAETGGKLLMCPAERADVIVDFTGVPLGNYTLANVGPDEPFKGGAYTPADPAATGQVMQFRVGPALSVDNSTPPQFLQLPAVPAVGPASLGRRLALLEGMSGFFDDAPSETMLGVVNGDPNAGPAMFHHQMWADPVSENPAAGAIEIWELYNATADAHPMHVHEVLFQVLNRQDIFVNEGAMTVQVQAGSQPLAPKPWERGFKDTVIAYPNQVTRIIAKFSTPGQYVWHCHIVEHEDNEMMRPYRIGPAPAGEPASAQTIQAAAAVDESTYSVQSTFLPVVTNE
ncbi:MAG: multicopper oxidase [Caldilineaceae bacterium]